MVPHSVTEILNQVQTKHLSAARLTRYEVALLTPSNLTIKRCNVLNPVTLLPHTDQPDDSAHDCYELMQLETEELTNVTDVPLHKCRSRNVDGSRYYTKHGKCHTGYSVVTINEVLVQKIQADTKQKTPEALENIKADDKGQRSHSPASVTTLGQPTAHGPVDIQNLQKLQQQASPQDKQKWTALGVKDSDTDRVWGNGLIHCLPRSLFPMMARHMEKSHAGKNAMAATVQRNWRAPGFSVFAE